MKGWSAAEGKGGRPHSAPTHSQSETDIPPMSESSGVVFKMQTPQSTQYSRCGPVPALQGEPRILQVKQNPQGILCTLTLDSPWPKVMNLGSAAGMNLNCQGVMRASCLLTNMPPVFLRFPFLLRRWSLLQEKLT